ncbi:enhancer of split mbeta protein-like [Lutzomyia longipalpis]|uniref:Putative transcriptional repressors of the hairy/espl family n=1 Tax=Lutzomyia longipalpis TaxID=7200 RepID=A0A1B0CKC9_LUTLO|nr:enhancer of split mbeta protein-like [Lutzomyia longipalpis]
MAPNHGFLLQNTMAEPVSRTYQYRKVMKPMLERKRRARINRCLDELKELMTGALQTEGENVAKLEKADILELTVRHLHTLRRQNALSVRPEHTYADRFKAGFRHCAAEVTTFLSGMDQATRMHLTSHLSGCIRRLDVTQPPVWVGPTPASPPRPAPPNYANIQTPPPVMPLQPSSPPAHQGDESSGPWRPW